MHGIAIGAARGSSRGLTRARGTRASRVPATPRPLVLVALVGPSWSVVGASVCSVVLLVLPVLAVVVPQEGRSGGALVWKDAGSRALTHT